MAISKLIFNGVVQMDVTGDTVDSTNLLSGFQATGADGQPVYGAYVPAGTGYAVTVTNYTSAENTPATISGIVNNGYYSGVTYFTVACALPCVVAYTTNGGTSWTRLYATTTGATNTYLFSVNVTQAMNITVAIKGDSTCEGKLNSTDKTQLSRYLNGLRDLPFPPSVDLDVDGDVDSDDYDILDNVLSNLATLDWDLA